mgnify:CR=1 FL=1
MKYRMLTNEEQEIFDEDFKYFLITNGVTNEEWEEMNEGSSDKAKTLVEMFSDSVLQKVYEKIKFLEFRSKNSCLVFKLNEKEIELISLNGKKGIEVDLSSPENIHEILVNRPSSLTVFKTIKPFTKIREDEIHEMLEQGCLNSSEAFWTSLLKIIE